MLTIGVDSISIPKLCPSNPIDTSEKRWHRIFHDNIDFAVLPVDLERPVLKAVLTWYRLLFLRTVKPSETAVTLIKLKGQDMKTDSLGVYFLHHCGFHYSMSVCGGFSDKQ